MDTHEPLKKQELHSLFNFVLISQAVNPGSGAISPPAGAATNSKKYIIHENTAVQAVPFYSVIFCFKSLKEQQAQLKAQI